MRACIAILALTITACQPSAREPLTVRAHREFPAKAGPDEARAICASRLAQTLAATNNAGGALLVFDTCMHEHGWQVVR